MNMENKDMADLAEDKEPIYFNPKLVGLVSDFANILSWVVLVGFAGDIIAGVVNLQSQITTQSIQLATLVKDPSFFVYLFTNLLVPLLTALVFFAVLQAVAHGLNILLEMDFNAREAKSSAK
ncbi:MAG: hypothetical protein WCE68_14100 [Anaerolineales bacterium]